VRNLPAATRRNEPSFPAFQWPRHSPSTKRAARQASREITRRQGPCI
jgi:hypothetical protein